MPSSAPASRSRSYSSRPASLQAIDILFSANKLVPSGVVSHIDYIIYVDPEAADIVFKSRTPITVFSLDVTHKALTSAAWVAEMRDLGTEVGRMVAAWTDFFERFDMEKYGSKGAPLHDPCTIAYLIKPGLFSGREINVEIETQSDLTRGMTVADWWRVTKRPANAMFMSEIDRDGFFALLTERLARL